MAINSKKGREIIKYIFENFSQYARIIVHDKKYALAAKIVEYGIEPYLNSNFLFYTSKLNEFIATGLYVSFFTNDTSAEKIFQEYLAILRGKLSFYNSTLGELSTENPILEWVINIAMHNPQTIIDEIGDEGKVEKWILDLTTNSLLGILTEWSKKGEKLDVICDNSKVFENNQIFDVFNKMGLVNQRIDFLGVSLGFNLCKEIETGDSKQILGLQIADLFSSTVFYSLRNSEDPFSKEIKEIFLKNCLCTPETFCVMPKIISLEKEFEENKMFYYSFMASIYNDIMSK